MFIKITSVIEGSECQYKYQSEYDHKLHRSKEIDMEWALEKGLLKGYRLIGNTRVGETLVLNKDVAAKLPEIASGNFTYEEIECKYMNQTLYSDTNAFEVIEWITPTKCKLRELTPVFEEGEVHESTDKFEQNPNNVIFEVRMHKNGMFYEPGSRCCGYQPTEHPHYYYDLSF